MDAIAKGQGDPAVLGPRSTELNEERKRIAAELMAGPLPPEVVALHPTVLARYEQQLVELRDALSKGIRAGDSEAAEAIRELIETVTVFRDHSRLGGVTVEITGRLNALLGEQAYPNRVRGVWGKMVAEERYLQCHQSGFRRKWPIRSWRHSILTRYTETFDSMFVSNDSCAALSTRPKCLGMERVGTCLHGATAMVGIGRALPLERAAASS